MIKVAQPFVGNDEVNAGKEMLLFGSYVSGKRVREFEEKFAACHGTKYEVGGNSGTAALHVGLALLETAWRMK